MSSPIRAALRYDGPNASPVRRALRLAAVTLLPALLFVIYLCFSSIERILRVDTVVAGITGLLTFALGGIWCIAFVPLLVGSLVLLRRVFRDPEIPTEVKTGTATVVTVAFLSMLIVIGIWYSQYTRGWR